MIPSVSRLNHLRTSLKQQSTCLKNIRSDFGIACQCPNQQEQEGELGIIGFFEKFLLILHGLTLIWNMQYTINSYLWVVYPIFRLTEPQMQKESNFPLNPVQIYQTTCRGLQEHSCSTSHANLDPGAVQPLPHKTSPASPQGLSWLPTKPTAVALYFPKMLLLLQHQTKILIPFQPKSGPGSFPPLQGRQYQTHPAFLHNHVKDGHVLVHSTSITHKRKRETFAKSVHQVSKYKNP